MLEDRLLVWKLKRGCRESLCRIYEKYRDDLFRLAVSLLNETGAAEDVVHDVFLSFIRNAESFTLTGSLKGYLATCVANRARNINRGQKNNLNIAEWKTELLAENSACPAHWMTWGEDLKLLADAMAQLPDSQRESVTLHLQSGMKFREIAKFHGVPIKTVQSRYRIGLEKLRSLLNSQVEK